MISRLKDVCGPTADRYLKFLTIYFNVTLQAFRELDPHAKRREQRWKATTVNMREPICERRAETGKRERQSKSGSAAGASTAGKYCCIYAVRIEEDNKNVVKA